MNEETKPTPMLTVGTIVAACDALKLGLFQEMEAEIASLQQTMIKCPSLDVEIARTKAQYAVRMAQCDVDKNKILMDYFQTAALNNLKIE